MRTQHVRSNDRTKTNLSVLKQADISIATIARRCRGFASKNGLTWYKTRQSSYHAIAAMMAGHGAARGDNREVLEAVTAQMCNELVSEQNIHTIASEDIDEHTLMKAVDMLYVLDHYVLTGEMIPVPSRTPRGTGFNIPGNKGEEAFHQGVQRWMSSRWLPLIQNG